MVRLLNNTGGNDPFVANEENINAASIYSINEKPTTIDGLSTGVVGRQRLCVNQQREQSRKHSRYFFKCKSNALNIIHLGHSFNL